MPGQYRRRLAPRRVRSPIPSLWIRLLPSPSTLIWSPLCQIRCYPLRTLRARNAAVIGVRRPRLSYGDTSHSSMPPNPARRRSLLRRPPYCLGIGATRPPIFLLPKTSYRSTIESPRNRLRTPATLRRAFRFRPQDFEKFFPQKSYRRWAFLAKTPMKSASPSRFRDRTCLRGGHCKSLTTKPSTDNGPMKRPGVFISPGSPRGFRHPGAHTRAPRLNARSQSRSQDRTLATAAAADTVAMAEPGPTRPAGDPDSPLSVADPGTGRVFLLIAPSTRARRPCGLLSTSLSTGMGSHHARQVHPVRDRERVYHSSKPTAPRRHPKIPAQGGDGAFPGQHSHGNPRPIGHAGYTEGPQSSPPMPVAIFRSTQSLGKI